MLELTGNIRIKLDGLTCTLDSHYLNKHDEDNAGNPKKKRSVNSSLRIKPLSTISKLVRIDKRVADIYTVIVKKHESGIRLLGELEKN